MSSIVAGLLVALPLASAAYYNASSDYSSGALGGSPVQTFQSSNYTPIEFNFNVYPGAAELPGYLLIAPRGTAVAQAGGLIMDDEGGLVWDGTAYGQTLAFSIQTYQGQPVIAYWQGEFNAAGFGMGWDVLLDQSYSVIANVTTTIANKSIDFHEFQITTNDTALFTVYSIEEYDLSAYNVSTTDGTSGWIAAGYAQEVDIATGEALFTWKSLDHVDPSLCYATPGTTGVSEASPWDYFHINSIDKDDNGNYLISSRHCHALYYVSGADGSIIWTVNGMNSSFTMGEGSTFEWQHDARFRANGTQISVFDNAATDWESDESEARGLLLDIDTSNMTVTLAQAYLPWNATVSESQGNVQQQSNGNMLIGWGQTPFIGEYEADGTLLWSAQIGVGDVQNYRCLRANWTGYPTTSPNISVAANASTGSYDVAVSWNGATEVATWELLAGNDTSAAGASVLNASRAGFETVLSPSSIPGTVVQVRALASNGSTLGYSDFVGVNGTAEGGESAAESAAVTVGMASVAFTSAASTSTAAAVASASSTSGAAAALAARGWPAVLAAGVAALALSVV